MTNAWDGSVCRECGEGFDEESWDLRHTDARDGLGDVHEGCCSFCEDPTAGFTYVIERDDSWH